MKQILSKVMVVAALTSGLAVAAASPSSAMPHDWCMDSTHYWNQVAAYWATADQRWSDLVAWETAEQRLSTESGDTIYSAHTSQGEYEVVGWGSWQSQISWAHTRWENAADIAIDFYQNTTVCT